ncbi:amine oxidase [Planctomycetota bacterium]|nr:amine oxidase [Planctomycetota bacterium]
MRIAVIGSGISGLVVGWRLHRHCDLSVFEAGSHIGGHVNTVPVRFSDGRPELARPHDRASIPVDTGFIVHNPVNYPLLCRVFATLGVATQPSEMSFSVACSRSGVEWAGNSLASVFAQPGNLLSPGFWSMLRGIVRFNAQARSRLLAEGNEDLPLGEFLTSAGISRRAIEHYVIPIGSAIWSAPAARILEFPARRFASFLANHGMLQIGADRPEWRTVVGGSWRYVKAITKDWSDRIRLDTPVRRVRRLPDGVEVVSDQGPERFDRVVFACHSDQALALLESPHDAERTVLEALPYQANPAALHHDERLMPKQRIAWSAWNHRVGDGDAAVVTYWMNRLQRFTAPRPLLVTLNAEARIERERIIYETTYHHPRFTTGAAAAQGQRRAISGADHIHYCGAYWGNGFHEDGCASGLAVAAELGQPWP